MLDRTRIDIRLAHGMGFDPPLIVIPIERFGNQAAVFYTQGC
jgi:hypothetical protein